MQAILFEGVTNIATPPTNWDAEKYGECQPLPIQVANGYCRSIWKPSPEELEVLNKGGGFVLDVLGESQPVVALNVCELNFVEKFEEPESETVVITHDEVSDIEHGAVAVEPGDIIDEVAAPQDPNDTAGQRTH